MSIKKWDEKKSGQLRLDKLREWYESDNYVVRWNKYEAGAEFDGWAKKLTKYVLSGKCEIMIAGQNYNLQSGDYLHFPEGKYHFKVVGNQPVEIVLVFNLSDS